MIIRKDCIEGLKEIEDNTIDCIVTSPPYNKKGLLGNVKQGNQIWGKFNIDTTPTETTCLRKSIKVGW